MKLYLQYFLFIRLSNGNKEIIKPNNKGFYQEKNFISFYSRIDDCKSIIKTVHKLRRQGSQNTNAALKIFEKSEMIIKQSVNVVVKATVIAVKTNIPHIYKLKTY